MMDLKMKFGTFRIADVRFRFRLGAYLVFVTLAGCGLTNQQRAAIQQFGAATADFGKLTSDEFSATRVDYLAMQDLRKELNDTDPNPKTDFFTVERVNERVDACNALKQYGELLNTLATSSQTAEIKAASDSFIASLKKMKGVTISDAKASGIGQAVQSVGGLLIEFMRAAAIRKVIPAAHPHVVALIALVKRDFDPEGEHWSLGYDVTAEALRGAAALAEKRMKDPNSDISGSAIIQRARTTADDDQKRFASVSKQILNVATKLEQADQSLTDAIQANTVSTQDVNDYFTSVQSFIQLYEILRAK